MNESRIQKNESILLRILWMLLFVIAWQVAEIVLAGVVVVQLVYRLIYGAPSGSLMNFGDSLSQFLAQIGRFGTFHSDQKPWPFADWPTPRAPDGEAAHRVDPAPHPVRDEEPKL
ncbi:DUF4389 domain-containing protein [Pseudomonas cichorii]|uniref:DUF4389 domain-containing protein n=1 Tax=Pseudomonas lijiangensis TaxID=2995658 RepID=A0ABX8HMJ2_9PSED|nr:MULTISPECIES: DUF4389 domain-containing protein [Pseudomonas syringae group]MBX8492285.1 DUF4389 domain-containing protein [Pseudomonas cichorii]MBX8501456.1 DUF4389 domain-containing protein [Pseudomonas lijiangensis]MBX8506324.1 DUF4389 domain-containing protein [Pseudomonas lijiangensis]MBX8511530.1 DUF4389 domain-containing protein [Pseudomonas cichorii]MBX8523075.1 DUF4389 domain-containing protein [Pseudomonas cichorii]